MSDLAQTLYSRAAADWIRSPEGQSLWMQWAKSLPDGFTNEDMTRWLEACPQFQSYFERYMGWLLFDLERQGRIRRDEQGRYFPVD
jgi:hypothetical protein